MTIPPLVVQRVLYDIQGLVPLEVAPDAQVVEMIAPRVVAEPPDGSVVSFGWCARTWPVRLSAGGW